MNIEQTIRTELEKSIALKHLEIKDTTGKHVHHEHFSGGHHLSAVIVSDDFEPLNLLDRHQIVYKALGSMIKNEIHAFSMKTYTSNEWNENVS